MVSWMDFRPTPDGTLGKGVWTKPWDTTVENELHQLFHSRFKYEPIAILTHEGKNRLLTEFQWTPLARMTNKEARIARTTFIREHPELKVDHRRLAEALRNAGLYAESTTIFQVMKFLPSLISESGV